MKIKPQQYAQMLVESITEKSDLKKVAASLWYSLQKNKQYRDLPKILELIDEEFAKKNNLTLAKVYSEEKLSEAELNEIQKSLEVKNPNIRYSIFNIQKKNMVGGITVKVEDKIIDLSTINKINRLKQQLNKESN